jgi:predicted transcriptional regulator
MPHENTIVTMYCNNNAHDSVKYSLRELPDTNFVNGSINQPFNNCASYLENQKSNIENYLEKIINSTTNIVNAVNTAGTGTGDTTLSLIDQISTGLGVSQTLLAFIGILLVSSVSKKIRYIVKFLFYNIIKAFV